MDPTTVTVPQTDNVVELLSWACGVLLLAVVGMPPLFMKREDKMREAFVAELDKIRVTIAEGSALYNKALSDQLVVNERQRALLLAIKEKLQ